MFRQTWFTSTGVALAFLVMAGGPMPARAESYQKPVLGNAILAKVWGTRCPNVFTPSEVTEIQTFIDRWISTRPDNDKALFAEVFVQGLEASYTEKYSQPANCQTDALKQKARTILTRIRSASSDPAFWANLRETAARG